MTYEQAKIFIQILLSLSVAPSQTKKMYFEIKIVQHLLLNYLANDITRERVMGRENIQSLLIVLLIAKILTLCYYIHQDHKNMHDL